MSTVSELATVVANKKMNILSITAASIYKISNEISGLLLMAENLIGVAQQAELRLEETVAREFYTRCEQILAKCEEVALAKQQSDKRKYLYDLRVRRFLGC
jgi:hypothetical protein